MPAMSGDRTLRQVQEDAATDVGECDDREIGKVRTSKCGVQGGRGGGGGWREGGAIATGWTSPDQLVKACSRLPLSREGTTFVRVNVQVRFRLGGCMSNLLVMSFEDVEGPLPSPLSAAEDHVAAPCPGPPLLCVPLPQICYRRCTEDRRF